MKPRILIAGMALLAVIGGAAYSEYDRVTSSHQRIRAYIMHNAKAYKSDKAGIEDVLAKGVAICAAQIYQTELPPEHLKFFTLNIATDYEIVNQFGLKANEKQGEISDLRANVARKFYTSLPDELGKLPVARKQQLESLSLDFRNKREKLAHCTHANAYKFWLTEKPADT